MVSDEAEDVIVLTWKQTKVYLQIRATELVEVFYHHW